jgi:hypothetical protein
MERDTKTIETKLGNKIIIKSYLIAKEANALKEFAGEKLTISADAGETKQTFSAGGKYILEYERKELETVVISVNDKTENIYGELESLRLEEYAEVLKAVQDITKEVFPQVK